MALLRRHGRHCRASTLRAGQLARRGCRVAGTLTMMTAADAPAVKQWRRTLRR